MSGLIPFTKYIKITSGVGGGNNVATRQFCARMFTNNILVSPNSILQFSGSTLAEDVGNYFGTASEEYKRAVKYVGYTSPSITKPQALQFARWADVTSPGRIFSNTTAKVLATIKATTAGLLTFQFGAATVSLTGISFSAATSLADVAAELQTALRANAAPELSAATVTYDALSSRFTFTASPTGVVNESVGLVPVGTGNTDVGTQLGLYETLGAIWTDAQIVQEPVDAFTLSSSTNNNFGSFNFINTITLLQVTANAAYNAGLNVMFQYHVKVILANISGWSAALQSFAGCSLTYEDAALNEYPEQIPMAVQAATDFTKRNGAGGYMFRQIAGVSPSVGIPGSAVDYKTLDAANVNYYGVTQTAGQLIAFYQDGVLMGLATDPTDMNVYANEQWFKDYNGAQLMSMLLSLAKVSANVTGKGQALAVLQNGINQALFNGVISIGKTLGIVQQLFITEQTGDANAWIQVQNIGYWLDAVVESFVGTNGRTQYRIDYTLIYSKDDLIRSIVGTQELI